MAVLYHGNCHCGNYQFELSSPGEISSALTCPCSVCLKKGYLWLEVSSGNFQTTHDGRLTEYRTSSIQDKFCGQCGTGIVAEHLSGPLQGKILINGRTLREINPFQLAVNDEVSDKRAFGDNELRRALLPHNFSCHCGAVNAQLSLPVAHLDIREDNCSSCVRNAYIGVQPTKEQVAISGRGNTFEYRYGQKFTGLSHCITCGVLVYKTVYGPPITIFDRLPAEMRERALAVYYRNMSLQPLNVRTLDGIDTASLRIERNDEGTEGYELG
ncbi:glutathione-dependent formaldehyde-activating enzyme [Microdochium bolleyi]|uniref:Glutathione-dependent formaldehyde-activating enzyme n=1 Tax=Microdochium bolleyi TaxID=196109 RepID=A0A136INF9_9PEZI|nr:glutathione-dependent formaldehyde-activating enzyme [Microdochium bolleyi]